MYFPVGWPKFYNSQLQTGIHDVLNIIRFNRSRSLFVTLSNSTVYLWKTRPRVLLAVWSRDEKQIHDQGINGSVHWNPDSSMLVVITEGGYMIMLNIFEIDNEHIYYLEPTGFNHLQQLVRNGILKVEIAHKVTITVKGKITSVSTRKDEVVISTTEGWIFRFDWNGTLNDELSTSIFDLLFCVDLESSTPVGSPLPRDPGFYLTCLECSPVLGGYAAVFSDGRGGFLSSQTAEAKPSDIVGVFAKNLTNAISLSVNIKYQIIVYGQTSGQASAYIFDDFTGGLVLSHKYVLPKKDFPDEGIHFGEISSMSWTPDGSALATIWSKSGVAVWSVFGSLLMCIQSSDFGGEVFHQEAMTISSLDWSVEGYELLLLPIVPNKIADRQGVNEGDILSIKFVKSALSVNPCMSNRQHLFLQGEDSVYLNTGDVMLHNGGNAVFDKENGGVNSPSMHFSNKHWQTFQLPHNYIYSNWPIRYAAMDMESKYLAVAGMAGYALFSLAIRRWKLYGNETQEKNVTCRGGLTWWKDYLIVGCYNYQEDKDEVRIHHRQANLDIMLAQIVTVSAPIFLINTYNNILLVFCADFSVTFYKLEAVDASIHASRVKMSKISETSLEEYLIHPISVTSISLSGLKGEQSTTEMPSEDNEAHSLIANVAGRVLMLQKDKPAAERGAKKPITFLQPVVIASCVENIWYMVNPVNSTKQHLAESLWLACGAQGMQAWLPLFPTRRPLGFLSKRIMLHFPLNLYPLVVLFEDSVIIGIGSEDMDEFTSTPTCPDKMAFPYFNLERTTQVFLPQILRQLLRRNLGVHALDIARSCTNLPYFTHVLELMLHAVLEKEATASNPIPDPLLPRIVAFIQEFPQFLETVCHCARKTEIALWPHLFSIVGNPVELFKSCHQTGKLETAASYLLIIQSLESPSISRHHATILLETVLDNKNWILARDLVRFLRAIGIGEGESPPRTPVHYGHKSSFHQNMGNVNLDDSFSGTSPVMIPLSRQNSRSSMSATGVNPRSASASKEIKKDKNRPPNLKLSKRESIEKSNTASSTRPVTVESCEHFYIDMIMGRYARKLISNYSLNDLGTFAGHLEFDLVAWLTKERFRAACVDNFIRAMSYIHDQFDWPYPTSARSTLLYSPFTSRSTSQIDKAPVKDTLRPPSGIGTPPLTPIESELSYPNTTADDIEATLVTMEDKPGVEEISETASLQTVDDNGFLIALDGSHHELNLPNMDELMSALQHTEVKNKQSTGKLKYLLKIFTEARCLDWVIILSVVLFDLNSFMLVIEKVASFKDMTRPKLDILMSSLEDLNDWLEEKCPYYQPILYTITAHCETLYESTNSEEETTVLLQSKIDDKERKDGERIKTPRTEDEDSIEESRDPCEGDTNVKDDSSSEEEEKEEGCVIS